MEIAEIGIVDTRNILRTLQETYQYDFSDYALTSFKRRLERIMLVFNLKYPEMLINRLTSDKEFIEKFLNEILVPSTEMFRDPSLWRWLRDEYLADKAISPLKILIPESVSGDELYTLCVVLKENGVLQQSKIVATSICRSNIEKIQSGLFHVKKIDTSIENYKRYQGEADFEVYHKLVNNQAMRQKELIENVDFKILDITKEELPQGFDLILFRNRIIYYNPGLQTRMLEKLYKSLKLNGMLILGVKETFSGFEKRFVAVNENESVYQKKSQ